MRDIRFRGKAEMEVEKLDEIGIKHDKGWVIGNLIVDGGDPWIVGDLVEVDDEYIIHEFWVKVDPASVGQYTGIDDDKNDTPIHYGDILKVSSDEQYSNSYFTTMDDEWEMIMTVEWNHSAYSLQAVEDRFIEILMIEKDWNDFEFEVIGNKFDNPELLEVTP